jgi:hypothetical protein
MAFLAHFKFADAPAQNATTALDSEGGGTGSHSGTYSFTSPVSNGSIMPGGIEGRHVRIQNADSGSVTSLGNIADLRITGEMTVAFWYYTEDTDSWHPIIEINGINETQAENKLFAVNRESTGRLSMKWENGAGVDVDVNSINNIVIDFDRWLHCAVVREANGGNFNVKFYVNGVLVDTQDNGGSGYAGPDGGGNSLGFIGRDQASTEPVGTFRFDSLRIYNSAENATTILGIYNSELAEWEALVSRKNEQTISTETGSGEPYLAYPSGYRNERPGGGFQ